MEFHRRALLIRMQAYRRRAVRYIPLKSRNPQPPLDSLPFVKRVGFRDELEYRIVYESSDNDVKTFDECIPLATIHRLILSPQMSGQLADAVKEVLRKIDGCGELGIAHSDLIDSVEWKGLADAAH